MENLPIEGPFWGAPPASGPPDGRAKNRDHSARGRPARAGRPPRARALARSPRIGRRAIEELNQSEGEAGDVSEIIARRAAIEGALVARGQLIASLMFDQGVEQAAEGEAVAVELGPEWTPWSSLLVDSERQVLYAEEDAWISS